MTFIKYTNDGKAVIQPAALTLSGLDREETLEMHTLENAIVLLKPDMEPVEKAAAMMTVMRLAHSLWADMLADWENQEDDADPCDGCSGCDEDMFCNQYGFSLRFDQLEMFSQFLNGTHI